MRLTRQTAGAYACHASNPLSNVTAFLRVRVTPTGFRRVQWQSLAAGFGCVLAFALVTCLVHGFRYLMDRCVDPPWTPPPRDSIHRPCRSRFGWWECCGLSPRAKQIRHVLEAVEQYKSQQLERLRDNYNAQVRRWWGRPPPPQPRPLSASSAVSMATGAPHPRQLRPADGQDPNELPGPGQVPARRPRHAHPTTGHCSRTVQRSGTADTKKNQ